MAKHFEYPKTIREGHLDMFGHVNNATYLDLYEEARWEMITQNGFGVKDIQQTQMGPVLLEVDIKFKAEITNREEIVIHGKFREMKNSLIMVYDQWMTKADGNVASTAEFIVGLMDLKKRKLVKPGEKWLKAIGLTQEEVDEKLRG